MNNVNVEGEKPEQLERAYVDELMHDEIQIKSTTPEVTSFGKHKGFPNYPQIIIFDIIICILHIIRLTRVI